MFAIIVTGGKQYKVSVGEFVQIEKINANVGDTVTFDVIALQTAEGFKVGTPVVEGAKVTATVTEVGKDKKIYVMKYKAKKNEKKKIGHRQPFTKVEITAIEG
ncbi:MAG: 50S ribosomal protein L21 [Clostridia bacterium]|nr:50S ribosomal protein L21 [Clostridia bacterium]